ncbi:carbohydrate ABC transporter permease [Streptomyces sp. NPDC001508]|uniref:carbohydrate ABC transporter permease n=1 Tax=Streptomyces sp. NPDC001508 TaxID=3154656 RepID=UPI003316CD72
MTMRSRRLIGQLVRHLLLTVGAMVILLPFAVMLQTAFSTTGTTVHMGLSGLTVANFTKVWAQQPWLRLYANTAVMTALIFVGQVALGLPAGFALARREFAGKKVATLLVMACLVVPAQVIALPNYVLLARLGWTDSLAALVVPFTGSAFAVFLFRQFALTLPQSLFDAARLDGVGPIALVWRVALPNMRPALVALGVFSVVSHWNDLFWPSVMLQTDRAATVPYAIATYATTETFSDYGVQMAAATLAVLPLLLAFLVTQRQFVRGIAVAVNND